MILKHENNTTLILVVYYRSNFHSVGLYIYLFTSTVFGKQILTKNKYTMQFNKPSCDNISYLIDVYEIKNIIPITNLNFLVDLFILIFLVVKYI